MGSMRRIALSPVTAITAVGVLFWSSGAVLLNHPQTGLALPLVLLAPFAFGVFRLLRAPLLGANRTNIIFAAALTLLMAMPAIGPFTLGYAEWSQLVDAIGAIACATFAVRNLQALRRSHQRPDLAA